MRIQSSSKEPKICVLCSEIITTTDKRFVDDGIHRCLKCKCEPKEELTMWRKLALGQLN